MIASLWLVQTTIAPRDLKWSTIAVASAPPSIGSVPDPSSSNSTRAGSASIRSIDAMLVTCQEKVLRFAAIDCSSPMSAKTDRNTGSREPGAAGMCRPACAISASSPSVFSATVLPPVFGPVMTSTLDGGASQHVDRHRFGRLLARRLALAPLVAVVAGRGRGRQPVGDGADQQRVPGGVQFDDALVRHRRLDAADELREPRLRLDDVELGGALEGALEVEGPAAERVGQREQDPADFRGFLLLERDDVVVDLDRAERLEIEAGPARGTAVDDAGDRRAVLRARRRARSGRCGR